MVALAALVVLSAFWRPARHGAVLLAGAIIPMAAQAISAIIQIGQPISPDPVRVLGQPGHAARPDGQRGADPGVLDLLRVRGRADRLVRVDAVHPAGCRRARPGPPVRPRDAARRRRRLYRDGDQDGTGDADLAHQAAPAQGLK